MKIRAALIVELTIALLLADLATVAALNENFHKLDFRASPGAPAGSCQTRRLRRSP